MRRSAAARAIFEARQPVNVETPARLADHLAQRIQASTNAISKGLSGNYRSRARSFGLMV